MNKEILQGDWNILKGKIREKWGKLTEDDLTEVHGKKEQLIGKIQKRYGFAKEKALEEFATFEKQYCEQCSTANKAGECREHAQHSKHSHKH